MSNTEIKRERQENIGDIYILSRSVIYNTVTYHGIWSTLSKLDTMWLSEGWSCSDDGDELCLAAALVPCWNGPRHVVLLLLCWVMRTTLIDIDTSGYQVKAGHHHRYERDTAPWHRVTAWQLSSCIKAPRSSPCYPPHWTSPPNDAIIQHIPLPWNSSIIYVYLAFDTGARGLVNSKFRLKKGNDTLELS